MLFNCWFWTSITHVQKYKNKFIEYIAKNMEMPLTNMCNINDNVT